MLLENVEYTDNLPFSVSFSNVYEEDFHYHNEMEMLLVLRGRTSCKIFNVLYTLKKGDVLIIDSKDMHRIFDSSPDILMLDLYVDLQYYTDLYPDIDFMIFACEDYSKTSSIKYQDLQKRVSVLKHHIAKTALSVINGHRDLSYQMDCINDLIFTLVNQFQGFFIEDNKFKADRGNPGDIDLSRLYTIIKHIYQNYDQRITLEDLADIVYLNPYYISHLIKNTSGLSFQNFLNYVRLEYAEKRLVENRLTLTQISESCGFSSLSYFNKCFRDWYEITPAQYRKQLSPCERSYREPYSEKTAISMLESYTILSRSQKNREYISKSSHHIFIPVKYTHRTGKAFRKAFPLKILLSNDEDVFLLNYLESQIKALNPSSIIVDYQRFRSKKSRPEIMNILHSLQNMAYPLQILVGNMAVDPEEACLFKALNIPFIEAEDSCSRAYDAGTEREYPYTICTALGEVSKSPQDCICLSGSSKSIFTPQGLLTPFYHLYSVFARIEGNLTEQRDQYMIIKSDNAVYILISREDPDYKLKTHLHINEISGKFFLTEKTYTKKHSCYEIVKTLGNPILLSEKMKADINDYTGGVSNLSCIDAAESYDMNFDMEPDSFVLMEFRKLTPSAI
ncbi:hypothetical protein MASR2M70_16080 [Bacillota bacterium]